MKRQGQINTAGRMVGVFAFLLVCEYGLAEPVWWTSRSVLTTNETMDYAPLLLGQLKWMATNACAELEVNLPGGAGSAVADAVSAFQNSNNWSVANVGQLKMVGAPYYDRLIAEGYTNAYPWTSGTTTDDVDWAIANLGQLKFVFDFSLTTDADSDGLSDWWEVHYFGGLTNQTGSGDFDGDGLNNTNEYVHGGCPTNTDTDADGVSDNMEVTRETDLRDPQSRNITLYADTSLGSDTYDGVAPTWTGVHGPKVTVGGAIDVSVNQDAIQAASGVYSDEPANYSLGSRNLRIVPNGSVILR